MTRPRADSDGWLTDPISRDRVIAKTVVEGLHTVIVLLRGLRSDLDESMALRHEIERMQGDIRDLQDDVNRLSRPSTPSPTWGRKSYEYEPCDNPDCTLPFGHHAGHRASVHVGAGAR